MKINNQTGFTVLEVIVAIVVGGLFIIGMSGAVSNLNALNAKSERLTSANASAASKIEELRNAKFLALPATTTVVDFTDELASIIPPPRSAEYTVTDLNSSTKQIDLEIEYSDFGKTRTIEYSTVIGELGVGQY